MARRLVTVSGRLPRQRVLAEAATFALLLSACVVIIFGVSRSMPADKRPVDILMQSVLSAALAVPCGASWRSLRSAIRRKEHRNAAECGARGAATAED